MQKEILGTIYAEVSEDFQRGVCPIARCVKAEKHDLAVMHVAEEAVVEVRQIGNMDNGRGNFKNPQRGRVYSSHGLSPAIDTCEGGQREPKIIVAMRGRNPANPSDRNAGSPTEQRLEPNSQGICNALTSVQKDNMVLIRQATKEGYVECECGGVADLSYPNSKTRRGRVQDGGRTCPTITAESNGLCRIETQYRIRKLTPLECWRLMGFSDEDFHKAEEVNSNSQLYKQAGNSIVKDVLMAIFAQMLPEEAENKNEDGQKGD